MMESLEATEVVYEKICRSEPENIAQKIIGYILVQDHGEQEMLRLAFSPISAVQKTIQEAKTNLGLNSNTFFTLDRTPFSPTPSQPFPSAATFQPQIENSDFLPFSYSFPITNNDDSILLNQPTVNSGNQLQPSSFPGAHYYPRSSLRNLSIRGARNSLSQPEFPVKACHYFNKGFCKHGNNCRYSHRRSVPDAYPNWNDFSGEDQVLSPKTLKKLEWEIKEILNSRRGSPVSIASLPMMYSDKYGKSLQAEGYLTESRRHGKAGYSLTRLLSHMNTIRLIDRPHGQHSVILAEDAPKYMEHWSERNEPWPIVSGSRQIYLTFPAESTFSEDDVSDYFNTFGEVQDVRIPCQQKRMFGFVTFESADTVKTILSKGNPHFVCGARVLVKPYREKSKAVDRKYHDRHDPSMYYQLHHSDVETELHARWVPSSLIRKKFMEEQEQAMEVERRRFSEMRSVRKPMSNQSYVGCSPDELKLSEDDSGYPSIEQFNYPLDVWDGASRSQDNPNRIDANYAYDVQESGTGLELPENPFASPVATGIPTAV